VNVISSPNSHVVDVSSKYNCQHEDMSVKQAKSLDLSASSGHCSVEDAGQSLEHQSNQNKYSEGFRSLATDVSGIQKITPPDSSVSMLKSILFFFQQIFETSKWICDPALMEGEEGREEDGQNTLKISTFWPAFPSHSLRPIHILRVSVLPLLDHAEGNLTSLFAD
jgi:hypothetical protein